MKELVIETLADAGFEADLDIQSVTRTSAKIQNIRLKRDGENILQSGEIRAEYVWPDVRYGQLKRLELDDTTVWLKLGDDWQPSADWLQELLQDTPDSTNEPKVGFPEDGVNIADATLILTSPIGTATLYTDATIAAPDSFDAEITLAPSDFAYNGFAAEGAGFAKLSNRGTALSIQGQTQTATLSKADLKISDATLTFDGTANLDSRSYAGRVGINGGPIASPLFAADSVDLLWDGNISSLDEVEAEGEWTIASQGARTPRAERADELADILALAPTLSVVPVAEHFSDDLVKTIRGFLVGSDIAGTGQIRYDPTGFSVSPQGPVTVRTASNQMTLRPRKDAVFYGFKKTAEAIEVQLDAGFKHPVGLSLTDIKLNAGSPNGVKLEGIESFTAALKTTADWRATSGEGKAARLGPLNARLSYSGTSRPRKLTVDTSLDFDGALPGGYVEDLSLQGLLNVRLYDGRQVVDFTPRGDGRITLSRLETPTEWTVENADFKLAPTRGLFTRTQSLGKLDASLNDANFGLTKPQMDAAPAQRLDLTAGNLSLSGSLFPDRRQSWDIQFEDAAYASETLPSPGTKAAAMKGELTVELAPDTPAEFTLNSPSVTGETPLVRVTGMGVEMQGTPENYGISHTGGTVILIGTEFAETATSAGLGQFPADGVVQFSDGKYTGQASLRVAKAADAEVIVDYLYADGVGQAAVLVPSIEFANGGLQPQVLFPTLKGKIASVEGEAQARLNIAFADGTLTQSSGTVDLLDFNVGTAPGPIEGLNTSLTFTSLLPMESGGTQRLTMRSFNPGFALEDGIVDYRFLSDGVEVESARWPIGNGSFSLDPFTWIYTAEENRLTMRVEDVALEDFLENIGDGKIQATGNVVGEFPIIVRGVEVLIQGGKISVPEGGVLRVDPGPNVPNYSKSEALDALRGGDYVNLARNALREFQYRHLSAEVDGPLDGDLKIGLEFDGFNENTLNGQPFRFDTSVAGELFNIARSFNSNSQIKSQLLRQNGDLPEELLVGE